MEDKDSHIISHLIGDFGRWQAIVSILVSLLKLPIAWFQLSIVFLAPVVDFWCEVPKSNISRYNEVTSKVWQNESLNRCDVHCERYEFNTTVFTRTIVSEWDLVCGRGDLANVAQTTFMFGVLVGNILFGVAADKFGRKKPLMAAIFLQAASSFVLVFAHWFWMFLVLRFILAIATGGTMITSFVLCVEVVGGKWRTSIPILYQIPFGLANSLMAVMAYFLRDWRQLTLAMSLLSMGYLSYYWLIPESPRWLLAVGRVKEATDILEKATKKNGLSGKDIAGVLRQRTNSNDKLQVQQTSSDKTSTFLGLFRTQHLRRTTLSLFFNWFVAGMSVFGFTQFMSFVGGPSDIFLNFTIGGLVTVPGTLLCVFVVRRFGRRSTIICSGIAYGTACMLVSAFTPGAYTRDWPRILCAAVSITGMSVTFPALYLYSGELLPTVARNGGLGAASMFARLGSMIAPFVLSTSSWSDYAPLLILGGLPIVAVLILLPLPETKGRSLPDSLEEGENFGQ